MTTITFKAIHIATGIIHTVTNINIYDETVTCDETAAGDSVKFKFSDVIIKMSDSSDSKSIQKTITFE